MAQPRREAVAWFLARLNMLSPYNPAVQPLGIYPKEPKTNVHTKTCTRVFVAAGWITWR